MTKRILIIAHGHPELRAGGAERAAYSMFEAFKATEGIEATFLATTTPETLGHDGYLGAFRGRSDELLWAPPGIDAFRYASVDYDTLREQCREIAEALRPDVIYFHHYVHTGVEVFPLFKELAGAKQILVLHEYILICNHFGQMVKTGSHALCYRASPAECAACFPDRTSGKFFLRERWLKDALASIDQFVSPSEFLKSRFVDWGLAADRISVIENLLPRQLLERAAAPRLERTQGGRMRFGYFGQINPFKGAILLLEALRLIDDDLKDGLDVTIFGANLEMQPPEFRERVAQLIAQSEAKVTLFGPYRNEDVVDLMREMDWVVVPSTWWENSPVVIQEALAAGVPVLTSDIGGMAEKVSPGENGAHFRARSAADLARGIADAVHRRSGTLTGTYRFPSAEEWLGF